MYYIIINNQQLGPYSFDEIIDLKIPVETPIWCKNYNDWIPFSQAKEFHVTESTPAFADCPAQPSTPNIILKIIVPIIVWFLKNYKKAVIILLIVYLAVISWEYLSYQSNESEETIDSTASSILDSAAY